MENLNMKNSEQKHIGRSTPRANTINFKEKIINQSLKTRLLT
jgi:hypothetical protein